MSLEKKSWCVLVPVHERKFRAACTHDNHPFGSDLGINLDTVFFYELRPRLNQKLDKFRIFTLKFLAEIYKIEVMYIKKEL